MNGSSSPGNNCSTYNRILRDTYGRPSSHYAVYTQPSPGSNGITWNPTAISTSGLTWDADRLGSPI